MPQKRIDITGVRSGYLTAIRPTDERIHGYVVWECRCDCGNIVKIAATKISGGHSTHCGCRKRCGTDAMNAPEPNTAGISKYAQSGYEGVYKKGAKWLATINRNHMQIPLGLYATPEDAYHVRRDAVFHFDTDFWKWYCSLMENAETTTETSPNTETC